MASNGSAAPNTTDNGNNVIPISIENDLEKGVAPSLHRQNNSRTMCNCFHRQLDEDTENELVSQAGDIGDRELTSRGGTPGASHRFSIDYQTQGSVFPVAKDLLELYEFWSRHDPAKLNAVFAASPLKSEKIANTTLQNKQEEEKAGLPPLLEYIACLVYLAIFSIFGVISRYLLQKLFSPSVAGVTSDDGILYLDLPSNIVGSFMMGWLGVVFRGDISRVSEQLAIGLTTGYLGSLTAFSGWNQKMLELSVHGHWLFVTLGFIIGLFLSASSFIFGIETAKGMRWFLKRMGMDLSGSKSNRNSVKHHLMVVVTLVLMWGGLWVAMGLIEEKEFKTGGSGAQLWLACFFGPFGVWVRWLLARLNGRGLGKTGRLKWVPFGTLIVNISAASMMAALATLKNAVDTQDCDTVASSMQFGFLGCLSTVPAMISEFHAMRQSSHPWRGYVYVMVTVVSAFGFGILIYSVPIWTKAY